MCALREVVFKMESKPGYLTTEFWVSIITGLYMFFNTTGVLDQIPNKYSALLLAVITAAYSVSRGQAKQGVAFNPNA